MNSQQLGQQIKTNCKECIFAKYEDRTQVGCEADRIKHFGDLVVEAYDDDKEFYVINTFCNFYRTKSWVKENVDNLTKVKTENQISCEVLIDCDNIDKDFQLEVIDWLNNLEELPDPKPKIKITLFHRILDSDNIKDMVSPILKQKRRLFVSAHWDKNEYLHRSVLQSEFQYYVIIDGNKMPSPLLFNEIDDNINNKFNRFVVARKDNLYVVSNMAYQIQAYNSNSENYTKVFSDLMEWVKNSKIYIEI